MMFASLRQAGCFVERQVSVPLIFKGTQIEVPFRADLVVERKLLIELKSVERNAPVHAKQVLTYLRLMDLPSGLLINFGLVSYKLGVQRVANNFRDR